MNDYEIALTLETETVAHRRYLHENAEVGLNMPKAVSYVMAQLEKAGRKEEEPEEEPDTEDSVQ